MSGNTFGTLFRFTTFGESHGELIGCVIDGAPSKIPLSESDIQPALDRRRPGKSPLETQRAEADKVRIVSGVFDGLTTGTPIGLIIENTDHRSADYDDIKEKFRPAHADLPYQLAYGIRDYRGGGRASARETAMRVAAGAVAEKILKTMLGDSVSVSARLIRVGGETDPSRFAAVVEKARDEKNSVGGVIEIIAKGFPAGLGSPVYDKLDAELAKALMSVNAVKGVEIGDGFAAADLTGTENADEMVPDPDAPDGIGFLSNHAGGILGGLSTGQDIVVRIAVKPTPSVGMPLKTVDGNLNATDIVTKGRHDPCVALRAVPVAEAMVWCVLADAFLRRRAVCFNNDKD